MQHHFDLALAKVVAAGDGSHRVKIPIAAQKDAAGVIVQRAQKGIDGGSEFLLAQLLVDIGTVGDAFMQLLQRQRYLAPAPLIGRLLLEAVKRNATSDLTQKGFQKAWLVGRHGPPGVKVSIVFALLGIGR